MTSEIPLFTREAVVKAKGVVENPADPVKALGEDLFCVLGTAGIHRAWFGVVHPARAQLPAEMSWVVGDAVLSPRRPPFGYREPPLRVRPATKGDGQNGLVKLDCKTGET